jgi:hypothetical protein
MVTRTRLSVLSLRLRLRRLNSSRSSRYALPGMNSRPSRSTLGFAVAPLCRQRKRRHPDASAANPARSRRPLRRAPSPCQHTRCRRAALPTDRVRPAQGGRRGARGFARSARAAPPRRAELLERERRLAPLGQAEEAVLMLERRVRAGTRRSRDCALPPGSADSMPYPRARLDARAGHRVIGAQQHAGEPRREQLRGAPR